MQPYPVLAQLQGSWQCTDLDLSFNIVDSNILNILENGVVQEPAQLKLQWNNHLSTWQINIPFFTAHDAYIKCINATAFEVLNLSILVTDPNFQLNIDLSDRNRVFRFTRT